MALLSVLVMDCAIKAGFPTLFCFPEHQICCHPFSPAAGLASSFSSYPLDVKNVH